MKKVERAYRSGETIFREGDQSRSAFVLIEGRIEIAKHTPGGLVVLAVLEPGEMFGEMGIFDQSLRSTTARAVGDVLVQVIPREEFLAAVRREPETALSVLGRLIERLRRTNELLAQGALRTAPDRPNAAPNLRRPGLLERLLGTPEATRPERLEIRIARLRGDADGAATRTLVEVFAKRKGLRARALDEPLAPEGFGGLDAHLATLGAKARQWLTRTGGDLLIWGDLADTGTAMALRFVSLIPEDEERVGYFGQIVSLHLPLSPPPPLADLLMAAVLAATVPPTPAKALTIRPALAAAFEVAQGVLKELPADLTTRERASAHAVFAAIAAAAARQEGGVQLYRIAAEHCREAVVRLDKRVDALEWALVRRTQGVVLQALADAEDASALLRDAAQCFRDALGVIGRAVSPRDWAMLNNHLGQVLYRLDVRVENPEMIKEALACFQAALRVYTRTEAPYKWAEVMNNIGQTAQVLGGQLHSLEIIDKAIIACQGALEVRTREATPLLWAATTNNLGSALFMKGKLASDRTALAEAAQAFRAALELYGGVGAQRLAVLTEKNLVHAERLLADGERGTRQAPVAAVGEFG